MWQAFVSWFSSVIQYMYDITVAIGLPNYGLAIILMTILIKLIMFPLTQKQMKSMRGMQEIQPKMKILQERYKDDPQTMQTKIMELYKQNGVSPFGGCLPLVIQMPIFIAFYRSLMTFEFKVQAHASFLGISNIGESVWKLTVEQGAFWALYVPILAGLTTYLQQKISTVDSNDPTQRTMLMMMPLFMAWIAATLPAGLPIYWIMFNILGILQQLYVNKTSRLKPQTVMPEAETKPVEESKAIEKKGMTKDSASKTDEPKEAAKKNMPKEEKTAGSGKGGKKNNGRSGSNNRKKRKKR